LYVQVFSPPKFQVFKILWHKTIDLPLEHLTESRIVFFHQVALLLGEPFVMDSPAFVF
jgi:hypothetical protein